MSGLYKFIFDGLPVRGALLKLADPWVEVLRRRSSNTADGGYDVPVYEMLGEMLAAAVLMQSNIKFDGALVLQLLGDGPVKIAVVEVQSNFSLRAMAAVRASVPVGSRLSQMVNNNGLGRCVITLDPRMRIKGQQPYQGIVSLVDEQGHNIESVSAVLEHYMRQSEQLHTTLVLAADQNVAAGLLIQQMPLQPHGNLISADSMEIAGEGALQMSEHYNRISTLARSLQREELLTLDAQTILHRLFWQEVLTQFDPLAGDMAPQFACNCSRERVGRMLIGLGLEEVQSILVQRPEVEVSCEFCGLQYRFDSVDVGELFAPAASRYTTNSAGGMH